MTLSLKGVVYTYEGALRALNIPQSIFLLLVRLYWGWLFAQPGYGKLLHIDRTSQFFASLGMPLPTFNAYLIGLTELAGGFLMSLGLGTRFVGAFLAGEMFVAYLVAHRSELLNIFSQPEEFYTAPPFTFLLVSLLLLLFGAGALSLDNLVSKVLKSIK